MADKEPGFPVGKRREENHHSEGWQEGGRKDDPEPDEAKPLPKGVDGFSAGKGKGRKK